MTMRLKLRLVAIGMTCFWALGEWFLLELRRTPYRPPYDMRTLLGTEREFVEWAMVFVAFAWGVGLGVICVYAGFKSIDYVYLGLTLAILASLMTAIAIFPPWSVTPYELLWS